MLNALIFFTLASGGTAYVKTDQIAAITPSICYVSGRSGPCTAVILNSGTTLQSSDSVEKFIEILKKE